MIRNPEFPKFRGKIGNGKPKSVAKPKPFDTPVTLNVILFVENCNLAGKSVCILTPFFNWVINRFFARRNILCVKSIYCYFRDLSSPKPRR